jgi:hypothetical protein
LTVGEDGVHRFDVSRVRELVELQERTTPPTPDSFDDGDTTAAAFELFAQGVEPTDVVVRLKLPAAAVESLRARWAALRGGYHVPADVAREISAVRGVWIADAAALLENLRETLPTRCEKCHAEIGNGRNTWEAAYCGGCANLLSAEHAREAARHSAQQKARREREKEIEKAFEEEHKRNNEFIKAMQAPPEERLKRMMLALGK